MISKRTGSRITAEQLLAKPRDGNRYELIQGRLITMGPAGSEHGKIAGRIFARLHNHVEAKRLGETFAAETGFLISSLPDTVRAPDAAFVSNKKLADGEATTGFLALAPDLVVEVISPSDASSAVEAKAQQWLLAGTLLVLVADPANATLRVYRDQHQIQMLRSGETFHAGDVCDGWELSVDDAFLVRND